MLARVSKPMVSCMFDSHRNIVLVPIELVPI